MVEDWRGDLEVWLAPFLAALRHKTRARMCPAYIAGLIGPGDRKSVQPMAARAGDASYDQLHHFVSSGVWDAAPLEAALLAEADRMVGRDDAWLIVDDTSLPKKGTHSVGVAPQYASTLGKTSNCQTLVSLTLASGEVPIMAGLRLFLPESWISDPARLDRAGVPQDRRDYRTKPEIALAEIDRVRVAGVRFGCVLADAGYGLSASFRQGLSERGLTWAVGIPYKQKVYPADVEMIFPVAGRGRPRQRHIPDAVSIGAQAMLEQAKWQTVSWRRGTKGRLSARFSALRVRVADGTPQRIHDMGAQHLPGEEVWLVGEHRSTGERKYYLSNLPPDTTMKQLAGAIKARWICEQAHQQLKEELGLDHFEGRSWSGLHRHCLMSMIAFAFLQNQRLKKAKGGKKNRRTTTTTEPASHTPGNPHRARTTATITVPALPQTHNI
jgi:SRSO17 transposase